MRSWTRTARAGARRAIAKLSRRPADITRCRPTSPRPTDRATAAGRETRLRASLIKEVKTRRASSAPLSPLPPRACERASEGNIYLTTADEREDFATPPPYFIFASSSPPSFLRAVPSRSGSPPRIFALLPIVSVCQRFAFVCEKVPLIICKARSPGRQVQLRYTY